MASLAAVVAAASVAALPAPSDAVARPTLVRQLTLTGDRTAYLPVTLPKPVQAECSSDTSCAPKAQFRVSGGAIGLFLVYENDVAAKPVPSLIVARMPKSEGGRVIAMGGGTDPRTGAEVSETGMLPAGRYRLFLLTNGRGSVSVRFPELAPGSRALRPAKTAAFRAVEAAPTYVGPLAPSAWAGGITVPATGIRSHGYVFEWTEGPAAAGVYGGLCSYAGDPPGGVWVPGCPGGNSLLSNHVMPSTDCCGTSYGAVVGTGDRFSFGSYYVQNGPVTSAGRFIVWISDR